MVTIGAATSADIDHLADLWVELARDQRAHGSHLLPDENRNNVRNSIARHVIENTLLVARDPAVVGFVMFELQSGVYEQATTRGVIQNIYVEPERRDSGIGTKLLDAAENTLVERGAERLALEVMAGNEDARRLYRNRGYEPHRIELEKSVENDNHSKE
ncbi:GNAT family N-acetyltransferase [Haladaptatus caseinilyticus]|uniref:GNAT family N-acetyltransferase n=1 Tax=Haladaptatus caseinilyticus TaxID=2993314 RepID=UPI00224A5025|nr:GNAT family N-acetyltransferase [Haladaptatus caseinilyticus]